MEKISTPQEDQLLDYLDGKLNGPGLQSLKAELEKSPALNARLEELRMVHETLLQAKLEMPSVNFTSKLMNNLHRLPGTSSLSPRNGLFLIAGMFVAVAILSMVVQAGIFDQLTGLESLPSLPANKYFQPTLPTFNVKVKLIINVIIGVNLVLGFIILDRTVLRPFFKRRSAAF